MFTFWEKSRLNFLKMEAVIYVTTEGSYSYLPQDYFYLIAGLR